MNGTKSPLSSLTINAAVIGLVVQLLALFGIQIAPDEAAQIGASINSIITAVALVVAIYGRFRASRKIVATPPPTVRCSAVAALLALGLALVLGGCVGGGLGSAGTAAVRDPAAALVKADALALQLQVVTEAAIQAGVLTGARADAALDRAAGVRAAVQIAASIAGMNGPSSAEERIKAAIAMAVTAQQLVPVLLVPH